MLEGGFILLHRSILRWEWYGDLNTARLFIHLLLTVNYEPQRWQGIAVERGQRVASLAKLADETGLTVKQVRTALEHLKRTGEVTHTATSKYGLFTVNHYDRYQPRGEPEGMENGIQGAGGGQAKRDLPQALAAQGLTGGMSESALAGMYNSYGNNRNTIDRGRNESLAALLDTLNSNRSSALQSYNSQLSAAEQQKMAYQMQLEQALANGSAEILQNKYDTLQNLDNAYAQQILALQQAAAQAAQKRW